MKFTNLLAGNFQPIPGIWWLNFPSSGLPGNKALAGEVARPNFNTSGSIPKRILHVIWRRCRMVWREYPKGIQQFNNLWRYVMKRHMLIQMTCASLNIDALPFDPHNQRQQDVNGERRSTGASCIWGRFG